MCNRFFKTMKKLFELCLLYSTILYLYSSNSDNISENISKNINKISPSIFHKIKSKYICQKIFNNLNEKVRFNIPRYNKKIQQLLNFKFNNYVEFYRIYNIIDIKVIFNKDNCENNNFNQDITNLFTNQRYKIIDISNEKDNNKKNNQNVKNYLYYDKDSNTRNLIMQIKKNKTTLKLTIKGFFINKNNWSQFNNIISSLNKYGNMKLKVISKWGFTICREMIKNLINCTEIDLSKFNTINVTDMSYMIYGCSSLNKLNLNYFNTSNVTNMSYMVHL